MKRLLALSGTAAVMPASVEAPRRRMDSLVPVRLDYVRLTAVSG